MSCLVVHGPSVYLASFELYEGISLACLPQDLLVSHQCLIIEERLELFVSTPLT